MENKFTVLYVDDEEFNLRLFKINFEKRFNIVTAISGEEGIKILRENDHIDVVISDMKMPGMNGIEFIKQSKQEFPEIYYFILTGFDITEEIADAINSNLILRYFSKPMNVKEIEKTITQSLN